MTKKTEELASEIRQVRQEQKQSQASGSVQSGYSITINLLTDLVGCVLIGLSLGIFFQRVFNTSPILTAGLTLLGGVAGLWTVIRQAIRLQKKR